MTRVKMIEKSGGMAVCFYSAFLKLCWIAQRPRRKISRKGLSILAPAILCGSVTAPLLLLNGLTRPI